ncbi:MAG: VWA domain-containing protein [Deltaproteobacteria bacterium]|nr:MAG: VWA domain-containing protein [Deltaproteobacteria bacterium]
MIHTIDFEFASPWAWLLGGVLLLVVAALWRWPRRPPAVSLADPPAVRRTLRLALVIELVLVSLGLFFCFAPLLGLAGIPRELFAWGLGLLLAAVLNAAAALALRPRQQAVLRFSTVQGLLAAERGRPGPWRHLVPLLRLLVVAALLVALARPQVATTEADIFAEGMDIVITLDVSTSMNAVDFAPRQQPTERLSRIHGAKQVIADFIRQRRQDRLALVVFAAEAFTQCPLTLDYSVLQNVLRTIRTGVITDGTAIGDAIMVSINRLLHSEAKSKAIVLLTDGDDNASQVAPLQAADIAAGKSINIFPIMVGRGGKVPFPVGKNVFGQTQYQYVEIRTNPQLLQQIARRTRGKFYRAVDKRALERDLQDILDHMEKTRLMDPGRFTRRAEMFQLLLLPALLLLLLELALRWTRFRTFP